jgi:hypothetical protein
MSTFLAILQIVCYVVGIVSAALNIAGLVRRWQAIGAPYDSDEPGSWP